MFRWYLFLFVSSFANAQSPVIVTDLHSQWRVYEEGSYRSSAIPHQTWHLDFHTERHGGEFLEVEAAEPFAVFIDRTLSVRSVRRIYWSVDSLARRYRDVQISVAFARAVPAPVARLTLPSDPHPLWMAPAGTRPSSQFSYFTTVVALGLLTIFIMLMQSNPQLMMDYLNFIKLFSLQEREENLVANRIGSSNNLLFYAFSAMGSAYLLMVLYHFAPGRLPAIGHFSESTWMGNLWSWLALSCVILMVLVAKLIVINLLSVLFHVRDTTALQFFNFIRLFFFTFIALTILCLVYFALGGNSTGFYGGLVTAVLVVSILYVLIIYFKLLGRTHFRYFHLFSYLCATEILPLVILIRILIY
ncbi:MAG: DUF4271 domain-containing protein [Cyclobacteriaceae bacterium]|nr:DUF4271 domain-containing protein [Cyclobacteriaceae bacterium]